jgi:hypothetical protein
MGSTDRGVRPMPTRSESTTYETVPGYPRNTFLTGAALVAVGLVGTLVTGHVEVLLAVVMGTILVIVGFWRPHRVTLDDDGVLFDALARHVRIPWDDLVSVSPVAVGYGSRVLVWRRRRGKGVWTPLGFPLLHRMLSEVEQRAPHVDVSS